MTLVASRKTKQRQPKTMTRSAEKLVSRPSPTDVAHRAYREDLARAYLAVGTSPKDRAAWLLRFGTGELDPSSLDRVAAEVDAFIASALDSPDSPLPLNAVVFTPGVVEPIHSEWKAALGALHNTNSALSPSRIRFGLHWDRRSGAVALGAGQNDTLGVFFMVAFQLLTRTGLRRCERDQCAAKFFIPSRTDQTYCGKKCRDAAAQARARMEQPEEVSRRRNEKHQRKVDKERKAKGLMKARVGRRPRKAK